MKYITTAAVVLMLCTLSACGTMAKMGMSDGMSATECFTEGGTIDNTGDSPMCKMGDDKAVPII